MIGTIEELKTEAEAQKSVDALRLTINEQTPRQQLRQITFETLVEHYRQHEMPDIFYKDSQLPDAVAGTTIGRATPPRTPTRAT